MSKGISEKELAARLKKVPGATPGYYTPDFTALAREAAAALGQPLAPEKSERPGYWNQASVTVSSGGSATLHLGCGVFQVKNIDVRGIYALRDSWNLRLTLEQRIADALHLLECDQIEEAVKVLRGREEGA